MDQSVNDIQLNALLLENLYKRSLVSVDDPENPPAPQGATPFLKERKVAADAEQKIKYLGNNSKNITILVNDPGNTFMPEGHLSFLTKILGACKLNIGDVAIVNTAHTSNIDNIIGILHPAKIFSFGIDVTINGVDHVKAPAIGELLPETEEAKTKKAKLWTDLKRLLNL